MPKAANVSPREEPPDLRARLIGAAGAILASEGIEALTLRAAARSSGVSHMAPYRHFASKDELLAAVAEGGFRALTAAMDRAGRDGSGVAYVEFALAHPALYRLMFGPNLVPHERFAGLADAGQEAYGRCIAATTTNPCGPETQDGSHDPVAGIALWAAVHGLASLAIDGLVPLPESPEDRRQLIGDVLRRSSGPGAPAISPAS